MTRTLNRRAAKVAALVLYIIVILVATPQAQQPVAFSGAPGAMSAGPAATVGEPTTVDLLVGRSTILNVGSAIARVSLTVPDVADAMVTAPQQLLIHGKTPGIISLFVWDRAGGIKTYEVSVRRDLTHLVEQMKQLFPGEPISVVGSGKDVVVSGTVTSKYVIDKAAEVASGYVEKKENVVNLLKQLEGQASNQVMLRVRFAEVSRSALQELGANFVANGYKSQWFGRTTTGQFPAPEWDNEGRRARVQRLPEPVRVQHPAGSGRRHSRAVEQGTVPEPGRAEPDRAATAKRRASSPAANTRIPSSARLRRQRRHDHVQGVRRAPELHADRARRRPDRPQGPPRGQLARLQQRRHAGRLPRPGTLDAPHRDRKSSSRTARRSRSPG